MKIGVYCASSTAVSQENIELGFEVGKAIAIAGHELVWGGGAISVMGAVARGARSVGGITTGVIPHRLISVEFLDREASQMHVVADMRERKAMIEEISDSFITLPGGIGTLEEFFEIWVSKYLGFHNKQIAVLDPYKTYDSLRTALDDLTRLNFMKPGQHELVNWCSSIEEALLIATLGEM
jgi:uncharacterized protein (TIGR00730 family)